MSLKWVTCLVVVSMLLAVVSAPILTCAPPAMQQDACLACQTSKYYAHVTPCYVVYGAETCDKVETVNQPLSASPCPVAAPDPHATFVTPCLAVLCIEVVSWLIVWWARDLVIAWWGRRQSSPRILLHILPRTPPAELLAHATLDCIFAGWINLNLVMHTARGHALSI
jgi:hypothetical protein